MALRVAPQAQNQNQSRLGPHVNVHIYRTTGYLGKRQLFHQLITQGGTSGDLGKTLLYVETDELATFHARKFTLKYREQFEIKSGANFISSTMSDSWQNELFDEFFKGEYKLMVSADLTGLGLEVPDLSRIAFFHVPSANSNFEMDRFLSRCNNGGGQGNVHIFIDINNQNDRAFVPVLLELLKEQGKCANVIDTLTEMLNRPAEGGLEEVEGVQ